MEKVFTSRPSLWLAVIITLGTPIYLMFACHKSSLITASLPIYFVVGMIGEWTGRKLLWEAPIVSYLFMVGCGVCGILSVEGAFYDKEVANLRRIVVYGSIVLLTIPILLLIRCMERNKFYATRRGSESAWFLLIGEGSHACMLTIVGRSIQQPCISPTMFRPSGVSELAPLRRHPESVPALPMCVSPLGVSPSCGWRIASLTRIVKRKIPRRIVRVTFGGWGV